MIINKLSVLILISIFIISSLAVIVQHSKGQSVAFIDSITIEVRTDEETALDDVANAGLDLFLHPVDADIYSSLSDSWKREMAAWGSIAGYNSLYYNPAHTVSPYECNVSGELKFNPFAIKKIRRAQNYLISREKIVDEFFDGFAEPRYLWINQQYSKYDKYFQQVKEGFDLSRSGDKQKGLQMIQDAMQSAVEDPELKGDLRRDGNYWEYKPPRGNWTDIEVKGNIVTEGKSEFIGDYQAELLNESGFNVDRIKKADHSTTIWSSDPSSLNWQFYTGRCFAESAQHYQEEILAKLYAGWFGRMPGSSSPDSDYRYGYDVNGEFNGNRTLEELTKELVNGQVNDMEDYWQKIIKASELGLNESVRVFTVTTYDYFAYDKDRIESAASDVLTGWSDLFTPRTLITSDGSLNTARYSPTGSLYDGSWNEIAGSFSSDISRQKKMIMDKGYAMSPSSGEPIPMRTDWKDSDGNDMIEKDYNWTINESDERILDKNISVPDDAVIYNSSTDQWEKVGSGARSAVKVTYNVIGGKWHSGANLTIRDVMGWHAWSWDLSFKDGSSDRYYNQGYASRNRKYFNSIMGERWNEENQTYTIWGDYTFPSNPSIGAYYSIWPKVPHYQYQAAQFMINKNSTFTPKGSGNYSWGRGADHWIDWLSDTQGEDITATLQRMIESDYIPWYMVEENNAPITVSPSELNSEMQAVLSFYNEHNHLFASNGPFMIDSLDHENMIIQMNRFTQEDGYPWPKDHWQSPHPAEIIVTDSEIPDEVQIPEEIPVYIDVMIDEDYPEDITRNVTWDDDPYADLELLNKDREVVEKNIPGFLKGRSRYFALLETSGLSAGEYTVKFTASIPVMMGKTVFTKKINLTSEPGELILTDFEVNPSEVEPGETVNITASAKNTGGTPITFDVRVPGEVINSFTLEPDDSIQIYETCTFDIEGVYVIEIGSEKRSVTVGTGDLIVSKFKFPAKKVVGEQFTISAEITNNGSIGLEDSIYVKGKPILNYTLQPWVSKTLEVNYSFETVGTFTISLGEEEKSIEIVEAVVIDEFNLSKDKIEKGDKIRIDVSITNNDDIEHIVKIKVDDKTVKNLTVYPGTDNYTYEHKFDEKGTYEITVSDQTAGEVKVKAKDTPGFGLSILLIAIIFIILINNKKKRRW